MTQLAMNFDVSKGRENPQSKAANPSRGSKRAMYDWILATLKQHGPLTGAELSRVMGIPFHRVSGRLTEMRGLGMIRRTGTVRDGGAEVRAV